MKDLLLLQQKIVPELIELLEKRYTILRAIYFKGPIGRRALALQLEMGERIVRKEVNFLKNQGLINIESVGMTITPDGENIIDTLKEYIHELKGFSSIEKMLQDRLGFSKVIIVPGNIDEDPLILKEVGRVGANYVKNLITDNQVIAVTGGNSVKELVNSMPKITNKSNILVVPARGGMGKLVETQANTITANLANKLNANYKLLHVPDVMSKEALETVGNEPVIKDIIKSIGKTSLLIYGIGRADDMSKKRGLSDEELKKLMDKKPVAEAFGYYFDSDGIIVDKTLTIGLKFEDVKKIKTIIAVAGGNSKAKAIIATKTYSKNSILITDEGAAKEMVRLLSSK
ncbi:MAG: sugar-binding domain-containing protein [Clostridiales bacterium]|nr:sugar-binding domain-containing protein [Clostridiales bacterium]